VLLSVETNVSCVHLGDFSSKVGKDAEVLKGVIGQHGDADVNDGAKRLLQLCRGNALCIMNTSFQQRDFSQLHLVQRLVG